MGSYVSSDTEIEAPRAIMTQILDHTHSQIPSVQIPTGLVGQRPPESAVLQRLAEFQRDQIRTAHRMLEDLYEVTGFNEIDIPPPIQPNMAETESVSEAASAHWEVSQFSGFESHKANQQRDVDSAVYFVRPGKPHQFGGITRISIYHKRCVLREPAPECKKIIAMIKPFDLIDKRRRQANPYDEFYDVPAGFAGQDMDEDYLRVRYLMKNNFKGVFLLHSGTAFKGQLRQLQRSGQGTFTHRGLNGLGRVVTIKRVVFQGNFVDDLPSGSGAMLDMDKSIKYEGKFKDGVPHGKGRIFYRDPDYSPGGATGNGKKTYINGDTYEGYLDKGLPEGRGKLHCARTSTTSVGIFEKGFLVSKSDAK